MTLIPPETLRSAVRAGILNETQAARLSLHLQAELGFRAALLRDVRQTAGLSLRELAARAGTSHSALAAYESGAKVPGVKTFLRVLHASECSVDIVRHRRVRFRNSMPRGEELRQVLELAEHFPNRYAKRKTALEFPRFPERASAGRG